jgi:signal transduction histidine kinase
MTWLPIRVRLTAAFAVAMIILLALGGQFLYLRLQSDLDRAIDAGLRSRADDVAALVAQADSGLAQSSRLARADESFAQVLRRDGSVYDSTPGATRPALGASEIRTLTSSRIIDDRQVSGIEGTARLLATPVTAQGLPLVVVVGSSVSERNEALHGMLGAFLMGGPIAVLLVSGIGYLLASFGLSPVEAMRRRAAWVTLERSGERLPLPKARDEIRRLGETMNAMLARLEESFERERAFVADASHELRTPLSVLQAELEVALRGGGYDEAVGAALRTAVEEVDQLTRLAEDLLLIARSDGAGLVVKREPTDLRQLLEAVIGRYRERAAAEGRGIVLEADAGLEALVDPLRIRQVVGNLIDNGLRYGAGTVRVCAEREGAVLSISVCDEGPGFPAGFEAQAFERFTRADHSRARGSAGLGLAIVRAIAHAHGGEARIEPTGRTQRVVVAVPLAAGQPAATPIRA